MKGFVFQYKNIELFARPSRTEKDKVEIVYLDKTMAMYAKKPAERVLISVNTRGETMRRTVIKALGMLKKSNDLGWMVVREGLGPSQTALTEWYKRLIGLRP